MRSGRAPRTCASLMKVGPRSAIAATSRSERPSWCPGRRVAGRPMMRNRRRSRRNPRRKGARVAKIRSPRRARFIRFASEVDPAGRTAAASRPGAEGPHRHGGGRGSAPTRVCTPSAPSGAGGEEAASLRASGPLSGAGAERSVRKPSAAGRPVAEGGVRQRCQEGAGGGSPSPFDAGRSPPGPGCGRDPCRHGLRRGGGLPGDRGAAPSSGEYARPGGPGAHLVRVRARGVPRSPSPSRAPPPAPQEP